jgi:Tfp pilus assembly protein PilF
MTSTGAQSALVLAMCFAVVTSAGCRSDAHEAETTSGLYGRALAAYQAGQFAEALSALERAQAMEPENVGVSTLLGWTHWRQGNVERARHFFQRAYDRDRSSTDAKTGLAFASLAQNDTTVAVPLLEDLARSPSATRDVLASLATAYVHAGKTRLAGDTYRTLVRRDPGDSAARRDLLGIYGYAEYRDDLPIDVVRAPRPAALQQWFRTRGDSFQTRDGSGWKNVYLVGANLGPAQPGEYPSTVSRDFAVYARWLAEMAAMHANTVRVYTILPPAFYRALAEHNAQAKQPIWLIQEVWIHDEAQDLFDPAIEDAFSTDLRYVIDLLHGQAEIPYRPGSHYGIYTADVSRWVIALGVGREVEPNLVQRTNARHPLETSHKGKYVSLKQGSPTEAWFARMCDLAASYEMETYNAQRPLTVVNWPPLDPLDHPAESPELTELALHQKRGEPIVINRLKLPDFWNDTDVVSLDVVKFRAEPAFTGGLFALYHVYQHWPDFLLNEQRFGDARDAEGPNRYLGYLQALKQVHPGFPLLIGEYGVATSLTPAHLHPQGWHNGGVTEAQQASLLTRFTTNHWETRAAGSIVFAWKDEWWKKVADQFTADYEVPRERDPLWFNVLDPEEAFGLIGYEPAFPVPLLRGRDADWERAERLYEGRPGGSLGAVHAMTDYAYLYLRLDLPPGTIDWSQRQYWFVLNTLPGGAGARTLPDTGVRIDSGANFLLQFVGPEQARLAITANYSPNHRVASLPGESHIMRRRGFTAAIADTAPFEDIVIEANRPRFTRDGTLIPSIDFNRSRLLHGVADRTRPDFTDHATWHFDPAAGRLEARIPWGLLYITDPSSRRALAGVDLDGVPQAHETPGISVAVLAVAAGSATPRAVFESLPPLAGSAFENAPRLYAWAPWNTVETKPYFKPSYFALGSLFEELGKRPKP